MTITISMQNRLWETRNLPGPGYNLADILNDIRAASDSGDLPWLDWNQPLRLDIQIIES